MGSTASISHPPFDKSPITTDNNNLMAQSKLRAPAQSKSTARPAYKRVLLKISGEGFSHEGGFGIEADEIENIAKQCVEVCKSGVELAIVVGGGNFIRGATFAEDGHIKRATADYMGMLATVINALALQETMEKFGQPTRVLSAISVYNVCEPFIRRRAIRHLEKGRAVILAAGTGNPFFTTDTCAEDDGAAFFEMSDGAAAD